MRMQKTRIDIVNELLKKYGWTMGELLLRNQFDGNSDLIKDAGFKTVKGKIVHAATYRTPSSSIFNYFSKMASRDDFDLFINSLENYLKTNPEMTFNNKIILNALREIDDKSRQMIEMDCGLGEYTKPYTRKEIAETMGIDFNTFTKKANYGYGSLNYAYDELKMQALEHETEFKETPAYTTLREEERRIKEEKKKIKEEKIRQSIIFEISKEQAKEAGETPIEELNLSARAQACLMRAGYDSIESLVNATEEDIIRVRNLGRRSMEEVVSKLEEKGLSFKAEEHTL